MEQIQQNQLLEQKSQEFISFLNRINQEIIIGSVYLGVCEKNVRSGVM